MWIISACNARWFHCHGSYPHELRRPPSQKLWQPVGYSRKLPGNPGNPSGVPESFPETLATRRVFPKASRKLWQPIGYSRKLPRNSGNPSGVPESFPETLATRRVFPKASQKLWQPIGCSRKLLRSFLCIRDDSWSYEGSIAVKLHPMFGI